MRKTFDQWMDEINKSLKIDMTFHDKYGDDYTFYGIFTIKEIWEKLQYKWKEETMESYLKKYVKYIFPLLNEKPLKDYRKEEFEDVLVKIRKRLRAEGLKYDDDNMYLFAYKLCIVTKAASELKNVKIPDELWGWRYKSHKTSNKEEQAKTELVRLRKSLKIEEEIYIAERLLKDPAEEGEYIGLALMYCLGLRNNEACAAHFIDIHRLGENRYCIYIYMSSEKDTRESKKGTKTANGVRIIPIPSKLVWLLDERKKYIKEKLGLTEAEVKQLTIACKGKDFKCQCKPSELSSYGTQLFRDASVNEQILMFIDEEIERARSEEPGAVEKDPTAYLFRRNFGTHIFVLGLDSSEIQYIMGHSIEDINESRRFFSNDDRLIRIAEKMEKRPIVNEIIQEKYYVENGHGYFQNVTNAVIRIKKNTKSEVINITSKQREPYSSGEMWFEENVNGKYYTTKNDEPYNAMTNIIPLYQDRFEKKIDNIKAKNNEEDEDESEPSC